MTIEPLQNNQLRHERLKEAVRRDILFLFFVLLAYIIVAYVETHADDLQIRTLLDNNGENCNTSTTTHTSIGILDAGFILTTPLHSYLANHRDINDLLAGLNSILLTLPLAYVVYVTIWLGDFRLSFRLIATHLFRTLCGWFTYLPPDPQFLSSLYDFPGKSALVLFHHVISRFILKSRCLTTSFELYVPIYVNAFANHMF